MIEKQSEYPQLIVGGSLDGKRPTGPMSRKLVTGNRETYIPHMLGAVKEDRSIQSFVVWALEGVSVADAFKQIFERYTPDANKP